MGISVEQYRSRIGTFNQSHFSKNRQKPDKFMTKCKDCKNLSSFPRYVNLTLLVLIFSLIYSSSWSYNFKSVHENKNIRLKMCSPKSGQIINHNFWAKITFGNRRKNGIKICQWNAGNGFLSSKQAELSSIMNQFKPHILGSRNLKILMMFKSLVISFFSLIQSIILL